MHTVTEQQLCQAVSDATKRALAIAETHLPDDVTAALQAAYASEKNPVARAELGAILENIALAEETNRPICQDTGVPVIFITLPRKIPLTAAIEEGVRDGVARATASIPLRPNVVSPMTRANSGTNCGEGMPIVHISPGDTFTLTALPKGAGSENVSRIAMLLPSRVDDIRRFVVETALEAGGRPCPPVILGVGIGGTFDRAALLAKEALLEPINDMDPFEQQICDDVNRLGIGPMGLGGATTCLAVKVKQAGCHTASLPVAVNIQCWAARRATVEVVL
ncbi:MAG TPA: fumarate hydratase [Methanoculleus sp.]|nr:fumarate hydratase [Methanoculleus sp.]